MFEWKEGNGQVAGSNVAQADGSRPISTGTEQTEKKQKSFARITLQRGLSTDFVGFFRCGWEKSMGNGRPTTDTMLE